MSEQLPNELPRDAASAATVQPEAMTCQSESIKLLEVMEICSELCVTHPFRLLQILEECTAAAREITLPPLFAEIMSLKVSPFGRRLEQIH